MSDMQQNKSEKEEGLVVLSLFNGMSTGHQALKELGIPVAKYYSSEIKPFAITLTQHHFPDTIQLGSIENAHEWDIDWSEIDLVLSGSPCQDLSIAGKRAGLKGKKSSLFWLFIEILYKVQELNPNVLFFQENVASAADKDVEIISSALCIQPILLDSALVTAQQRKRYYWSNIKTIRKGLFGRITTDVPIPKDKGILLKDIIEYGYLAREKARAILESESRPLSDSSKMYRRYKGKGFGNVVYQVNPSKESGGKQPYQHNRVYADYGKISTLTESQSARVKIAYEELEKEGVSVRPLTKTELCRLQGFPDDYCDILSRNQAGSVLGDGWTLPVIKHFFQFIKTHPNYKDRLCQNKKK